MCATCLAPTQERWKRTEQKIDSWYTNWQEIRPGGGRGYSTHWYIVKCYTNACLVIRKLAFCHRLVITSSAGVNSGFAAGGRASLWKVLHPPSVTHLPLWSPGSDRSVADSRHLFINKWVMQLGLLSPELCFQAAFPRWRLQGGGENSSAFLFHADGSIWRHVMAIHQNTVFLQQTKVPLFDFFFSFFNALISI